MARALKPHKMETFNQRKTGDTCDLMLDRNRKIFFADFMGEHFEHAEAKKVEAWIREQFAAEYKMEWVPIIDIEVGRDVVKAQREDGVTQAYDKFAALSIVADRYYVGVTKSGIIQSSQWDISWPFNDNLTDDQRRVERMKYCGTKYTIADGRIVLPWMADSRHSAFGSQKGDESKRYIHVAYSETLWHGLRHMQDALRDLGNQLELMIGNADGQKRISDVGERAIAAMLPPGEEKVKPESDTPVVRKKIEDVHFRLDPNYLADMGIVIEKDRGTQAAVDGELIENK